MNLSLIDLSNKIHKVFKFNLYSSNSLSYKIIFKIIYKIKIMILFKLVRIMNMLIKNVIKSVKDKIIYYFWKESNKKDKFTNWLKGYTPIIKIKN